MLTIGIFFSVIYFLLSILEGGQNKDFGGNGYYSLFLLSVVTLSQGQSSSLCEDVSTNACSLFLASNPSICSDPTISQSCLRFCGLCPVTCYDCISAVNSSVDCNTTTLCAADEVCMKKTHTANNGGKEFILSCEKKTTCDGLSFGFHSGNIVGKRSYRHIHRRDLTFECCGTDLCNLPAEFRSTRPPSTTTTQSTTPTPTVSYLNGCAKDVVFVLDGSTSIGPTNHAYMRSFVQNVIKGLTIGQNDSLVAMVEYSDTARVEWYLPDHSSIGDLLAASNSIPYVTGTTATHAALWLVHNSVLTARHGDRPNARDVVIVLTDGGTDSPALAITEAKQLHNIGVEVIAIGIGSNVDKQELSQLIQRNYFSVATFQTLRFIAASVKDSICK